MELEPRRPSSRIKFPSKAWEIDGNIPVIMGPASTNGEVGSRHNSRSPVRQGLSSRPRDRSNRKRGKSSRKGSSAAAATLSPDPEDPAVPEKPLEERSYSELFPDLDVLQQLPLVGVKAAGSAANGDLRDESRAVALDGKNEVDVMATTDGLDGNVATEGAVVGVLGPEEGANGRVMEDTDYKPHVQVESVTVAVISSTRGGLESSAATLVVTDVEVKACDLTPDASESEAPGVSALHPARGADPRALPTRMMTVEESASLMSPRSNDDFHSGDNGLLTNGFDGADVRSAMDGVELHDGNFVDSVTAAMEKERLAALDTMRLVKLKTKAQLPVMRINFSKVLPKPSFREISEPSSAADDLFLGLYNKIEFRKPGAHYVRYVEPTENELSERIEYDMDDQDLRWLQIVNEERRSQGDPVVPESVFELVIDRLEKEWQRNFLSHRGTNMHQRSLFVLYATTENARIVMLSYFATAVILPSIKTVTAYRTSRKGNAYHVTCARRVKLYMKIRINPLHVEEISMKSFCDKHCPKEHRDVIDVDAELASFRDSLAQSGNPVEDFDAPMDNKRKRKRSLMRRVIESDEEESTGADPWTVTASATKEDETFKATRNEVLRYVRNDLERVRILAELIKKREKDKLKQCQIQLEYVEFLVNPVTKVLRPVLEEVRRFDKPNHFAEPVNAVDVPEYYNIIKVPMDFATMKRKLESHQYRSMEIFKADVEQICKNAIEFNPAHTAWHRAAVRLKERVQPTLAKAAAQLENLPIDPTTGCLLLPHSRSFFSYCEPEVPTTEAAQEDSPPIPSETVEAVGGVDGVLPATPVNEEPIPPPPDGDEELAKALDMEVGLAPRVLRSTRKSDRGRSVSEKGKKSTKKGGTKEEAASTLETEAHEMDVDSTPANEEVDHTVRSRLRSSNSPADEQLQPRANAKKRGMATEQPVEPAEAAEVEGETKNGGEDGNQRKSKRRKGAPQVIAISGGQRGLVEESAQHDTGPEATKPKGKTEDAKENTMRRKSMRGKDAAGPTVAAPVAVAPNEIIEEVPLPEKRTTHKSKKSPATSKASPLTPVVNEAEADIPAEIKVGVANAALGEVALVEKVAKPKHKKTKSRGASPTKGKVKEVELPTEIESRPPVPVVVTTRQSDSFHMRRELMNRFEQEKPRHRNVNNKTLMVPPRFDMRDLDDDPVLLDLLEGLQKSAKNKVYA
ncbi:Bromodomain and PHD finger-containing protein 3 [Irineochytrium annulatum]|nr:Bromodomain and PHD finger-containing protein 3 [Irineochytrium annulatum]